MDGIWCALVLLPKMEKRETTHGINIYRPATATKRVRLPSSASSAESASQSVMVARQVARPRRRRQLLHSLVSCARLACFNFQAASPNVEAVRIPERRPEHAQQSKRDADCGGEHGFACQSCAASRRRN
jgi:hypothetical protein